VLEIQIITWDRHKDVAGLNQLMESHKNQYGIYLENRFVPKCVKYQFYNVCLISSSNIVNNIGFESLYS
jgi:hypothetical protein